MNTQNFIISNKKPKNKVHFTELAKAKFNKTLIKGDFPCKIYYTRISEETLCEQMLDFVFTPVAYGIFLN